MRVLGGARSMALMRSSPIRKRLHPRFTVPLASYEASRPGNHVQHLGAQRRRLLGHLLARHHARHLPCFAHEQSFCIPRRAAATQAANAPSHRPSRSWRNRASHRPSELAKRWHFLSGGQRGNKPLFLGKPARLFPCLLPLTPACSVSRWPALNSRKLFSNEKARQLVCVGGLCSVSWSG